MNKEYSLTIKIISLTVLITFVVTQAAWGYEQAGVATGARSYNSQKSHLRVQQARANGVGGEMAKELGGEVKRTIANSYGNNEDTNKQVTDARHKISRREFFKIAVGSGVSIGLMSKSAAAQLNKTSLRPDQKETVREIVDIYNSAYKLKMSNEQKEVIVNDIFFFTNLDFNGYSNNKFFKKGLLVSGIIASILAGISVAIHSIKKYRSKNLSKVGFITKIIFAVGIVGALFFGFLHIMSFPEIPPSYGMTIGTGNRIALSSELQNCNDMDFMILVAHELAHHLGLPNHRLLAHAYTTLVTWKMYSQYPITDFMVYKYVSQVSRAIPDQAKREATIRKILSREHFMQACEAKSHSSNVEITAHLKQICNGLTEEDYEIPHPETERVKPYINGDTWMYYYGYAMGYIAIENYSNLDEAFKYIKALGEADDSRDVNVVKANSMGKRDSEGYDKDTGNLILVIT